MEGKFVQWQKQLGNGRTSSGGNGSSGSSGGESSGEQQLIRKKLIWWSNNSSGRSGSRWRKRFLQWIPDDFDIAGQPLLHTGRGTLHQVDVADRVGHHGIITQGEAGGWWTAATMQADRRATRFLNKNKNRKKAVLRLYFTKSFHLKKKLWKRNKPKKNKTNTPIIQPANQQ